MKNLRILLGAVVILLGAGASEVWAQNKGSGNTAPAKPSSLQQTNVATNTQIPEGGWTGAGNLDVEIKAVVTDPNADNCTLEVEIRDINTPFFNFPTFTSASVASGSTVTASFTGFPGTAYHWQCRAVDSFGLASAWTVFGTAGNTDFGVGTGPELSTIGLSQTSFTFTAMVGLPNPPAQSLDVSNTGGGTLSWSAANLPGWLSVDPPSGSIQAGSSQTVSLMVNAAGLAVGPHTATISIIAGGTTNSPQPVNITLNVTEPTFELDPVTSIVNAPLGGPNPEPVRVSITNVSGSTISWNATDDAAWLTPVPVSGSLLPGETRVISLLADVALLEAGAHIATVTVTDPAVPQASQTAVVSLNVNSRANLILDPAEILVESSFESPVAPRTVTLSNQGGTDLEWNVESDVPWIRLTPDAGLLTPGASQTVTISIDETAVRSGINTATISVISESSIDPTALKANMEDTNVIGTVLVTCDVKTSPSITLSDEALTFEIPAVGPYTRSQTLTISNVGAGTLSWEALTDAAWLQVSLDSGAVEAGESMPLMVMVDATGLAPGTYTANLGFLHADSNGLTLAVPVTLHVNPSPKFLLSTDSITFRAVIGTGNPQDQSIVVTNVGSGFVNWSVTEDADWLTATPGGVTLDSGEKGQVDLKVDLNGLDLGTYTAVVQVTDPASTHPAQAVFVTLEIVPPAPVRPSTSNLELCSAGSSSRPGLTFLLLPLLFLLGVGCRRIG